MGEYVFNATDDVETTMVYITHEVTRKLIKMKNSTHFLLLLPIKEEMTPQLCTIIITAPLRRFDGHRELDLHDN